MSEMGEPSYHQHIFDGEYVGVMLVSYHCVMKTECLCEMFL